MFQVLKMLSCAVRTASLYAVINLSELYPCTDDHPGCPSDKKLFYNTNIILDRNGKLIARYVKKIYQLRKCCKIIQYCAHFSFCKTDEFGDLIIKKKNIVITILFVYSYEIKTKYFFLEYTFKIYCSTMNILVFSDTHFSCHYFHDERSVISKHIQIVLGIS